MTWTKLQTFTVLWDGFDDSYGALWRSDTGEYGLSFRCTATGPGEVATTAETIATLEDRLRCYEAVAQVTQRILDIVGATSDDAL
ncbi:MAG: hypothetical protein A2Z99_04350 [Treponema sp. GWB1_62_6]|nr:MAG: hypothetical protein A2Z99_04350 [Treponema sp. GWB1_62_6]